MKTTVKFAIIALFAMFITSAALAQEWSKEQKEVWQNVDAMWSKWKASDAAGAGALLHDKYQGWNGEMPLPMGKEKMVSMFTEMKDMYKLNYYSIEPARIVVSGNAAVVDYYFYYSETVTTGDTKKQEEHHGKNVEFYVKEGGKWLLLGDMSVYEKNRKDEDND
jgi:hypothetical protein